MQRKGSSHLFNSVHTCRLKLPQEQQHQEKSVIAQPIFVFEKREQTFKRPADDILYEAAERECNEFSRKRVRASSFTWHTTDSQNQGVKKNNVFMTSNSVQRNADLNSAEQCPVKHSELVLRPAILQPPQAQGYIKVRKSFGDHVLESCKVKEKNKSKIYEGNSYLLSENLPNARISIQLSTNQNALGTTSLRCQPSEDKYSMKSCSSDFVFGENMVERVLGTQKLTQPQLESDLYIKEKPFKFTLKIPVNSPNSIMRNQGSLRLILNSKLWAQMEIQRANHKNLQITATDLEDCNVKVFLIQASAKDTGRMHAAIHHRLVALRSFDKRTDANQTESQSETVLQQCNYDSCDEDEEDLIQATKARSDSYRWTHRQSVACS
ncbi:ran-binding protein 3-like isoform X4 [Bos indicus x Bos taurus]|uniref:ran-binding protein 3-like isoform X4 n=1 Tax=Bos taurus TaxID=9913 RepID=UPI000572B39A|nr:ran-binding protein 3-like isoform X4 [Bos taurus]XP_027375705.1 ran-binding protein 3-like isoform X4 [Bos indicus x Bos taurus]